KNSLYASAAEKRVLPDFSFGAAADWACNFNTENTVSNIISKNPKLVLGIGDYYYSDYYNESLGGGATTDAAQCWFKIVKPIEQKLRIAIGNHEHDSQSLLNLYMSRFNLTKQYYSFNYQNVHFLVISTELPLIGIGSAQYNFVSNDLEKAASNKNINWIIVYYHQTAYSPASKVTPYAKFREIYHPLFDKYRVDLVLQGHEHTYQRSYPMRYNVNNSFNPIITDNANSHNYTNPQGRIFTIVGTAGARLFPLYGHAPYIATQYIGHGFLDVTMTNNGKTLNAKFYANDGSVKDQFTINKHS
ncbi:MAG: metallophosphoesterase, partial [Nitrososphaeraceae archaeon]